MGEDYWGAGAACLAFASASSFSLFKFESKLPSELGDFGYSPPGFSSLLKGKESFEVCVCCFLGV
jgi:hypothetical protein